MRALRKRIQRQQRCNLHRPWKHQNSVAFFTMLQQQQHNDNSNDGNSSNSSSCNNTDSNGNSSSCSSRQRSQTQLRCNFLQEKPPRPHFLQKRARAILHRFERGNLKVSHLSNSTWSFSCMAEYFFAVNFFFDVTAFFFL